MRRVSEYKRLAEDCRKLARSQRWPQQKRQLEEMAIAWEMLAVEREAQLAEKSADSDEAVGAQRLRHWQDTTADLK